MLEVMSITCAQCGYSTDPIDTTHALPDPTSNPRPPSYCELHQDTPLSAPIQPSPCPECHQDPRLLGRYVLLRQLQSGEDAHTFYAWDTHAQRPVAIKELVCSRYHRDTSEQLFHREALVLEQLDHPAVPRYLADYVVERGRMRHLYLVQEWVEGHTLAEELKTTRYTEDDVLDIGCELAQILSALHQLTPPIIHRDLTPRNVMRRTDGRLVLIDFGAVRDAVIDPNLGGATVAGTFGFMAPEQFRGDVTPQTDLYGLGALLVTLLTRRAPHEHSIRSDGYTGGLMLRFAPIRMRPFSAYSRQNATSEHPVRRWHIARYERPDALRVTSFQHAPHDA